MLQAFTKITPVDVTPGTQDSYVDVDCSSYIPEGATGVILRVHCASGANQAVYFRKNGSTDNYYHNMWQYGQFWASVGVDSNRIFECKVSTKSYSWVYLVGYTMGDVTFFTNGVDKTPGTTGSWQDVDCSSEAPGAVALMFHRYADNTILSLRMNGSTDNRLGDLYYQSGVGAIIGCDSNQICECYAESSNADLILIGYATGGVVMNINAVDVSLGTATTWLDIFVNAAARMAFIEVYSTGALEYGLRENGDSEDQHRDAYKVPYAMVGCDDSGYVEGYIETTGVDFYAVGYAIQPAPNIYFLFGANPVAGDAHYLKLDVEAVKQCWGYLPFSVGQIIDQAARYLQFGPGATPSLDGSYLPWIITAVPRIPKPITGAWYQRLSSVKKTI
ncbi:MAG: hypothetical protein JXA50_01855 [Deltaproteobacteria bacterium]|nr:hypothetical protein [Deltaproteobacteria bacterium]